MIRKSNVISQRDARKWKRRAEDLEAMIQRQRSRYSSDFPGGTHLGVVVWNDDNHIASAVYTAQILGHAIVAVANGKRQFNLYALPHAEMPA